jgi:hypothetical protein
VAHFLSGGLVYFPSGVTISDRDIAGATFTYQIFRPIAALPVAFGRRFSTRGIHLFAGTLLDRELFTATTPRDDVTLRRRDYSVGVTARGLGPFDINVQLTLFSFESDVDATQDNAQRRINVSALYRIVDEEAQPGIAGNRSAMHLFPALRHSVKHYVARTGLTAYENVQSWPSSTRTSSVPRNKAPPIWRRRATIPGSPP